MSSAVNRWPDLADTYRAVQRDLQQLLTFALLPRNTLSDQEHFNIRQEFSRLRLLVHLLHCRHSISSDNIQVSVFFLLRQHPGQCLLSPPTTSRSVSSFSSDNIQVSVFFLLRQHPGQCLLSPPTTSRSVSSFSSDNIQVSVFFLLRQHPGQCLLSPPTTSRSVSSFSSDNTQVSFLFHLLAVAAGADPW